MTNELKVVDEHKIPLEELCSRYSTDITNVRILIDLIHINIDPILICTFFFLTQGLTTAQADKNLAMYPPS